MKAMSISRFVPDRSASPELKPRKKPLLSKKKMLQDVEKARKMQGRSTPSPCKKKYMTEGGKYMQVGKTNFMFGN